MVGPAQSTVATESEYTSRNPPPAGLAVGSGLNDLRVAVKLVAVSEITTGKPPPTRRRFPVGQIVHGPARVACTRRARCRRAVWFRILHFQQRRPMASSAGDRSLPN